MITNILLVYLTQMVIKQLLINRHGKIYLKINKYIIKNYLILQYNLIKLWLQIKVILAIFNYPDK